MLKKAVAVVFVGCALAFVVPREVEAVPMQCPEPPERLTLSPYEVSVDGALLYPASNGQYQTDGGLSFSVISSVLAAVEPADNSRCATTASTATLDVIDPFSGQQVQVPLEVAR